MKLTKLILADGDWHAALPFAALTDWLVAPVRTALLRLALELELPDILHNEHNLSRIAASLQAHCGKAVDAARLTSRFRKPCSRPF